MKEISNRLYLLIREQLQIFKKEFQVQEKKSLGNGPYYILICPVPAKNNITTELGEFIPIDTHISIYKEDKRELVHSAFHLTVNLTNKSGVKYCAHLFYDLSGDYLFYSFKDAANNSYELESKEELLGFGKKNIQSFLAILSELRQNYYKQYSTLVNKANNFSKSLDNNEAQGLSKKTLLRYKHSLSELIAFIESGTGFNQKHLEGIKIHQSLLQDTEQKLELLQSASRSTEPVIVETTASEEPSLPAGNKSVEKESHSTKMDELNKKINALSRKKNRTPSLLLQEHELYLKKLALLKKKDSNSLKKSPKKTNNYSTDDEFIIVLNKELQLKEEIHSWILNILRDDSRYSTEQNSLLLLIQESSLNTNILLQATVEYNRLPMFEYLVAQRKDLDVNARMSMSMLEIAYKKRHIDMFKLLLQHKASPDVICSNKKSLLYCACEEGRFQEMELLLEAGADPLIKTADGLNSFGALLLHLQPNLEQVQLFLKYAPSVLHQIQGKKNHECTPLVFACQRRWNKGVLFLLEQGANSNIKRDGGFTALGMCVVKNDLDLFKIILKHSKVALKESLENALDIAVFLKHRKNQDPSLFIQEIIRYNDSRKLETHIPEFKDASNRLEKAISLHKKASVNPQNFFQAGKKYNKELGDEPTLSPSK